MLLLRHFVCAALVAGRFVASAIADDEQADTPQTESPSPIVVLITPAQVAIARTPAEATRWQQVTPANATLLTCRTLQFEGVLQEGQHTLRMKCQGVKAKSAQSEFDADSMVFDFSTQSLVLEGTNEKRVRMRRRSATGEVSVVSAKRIVIDLKQLKVRAEEIGHLELSLRPAASVGRSSAYPPPPRQAPAISQLPTWIPRFRQPIVPQPSIPNAYRIHPVLPPVYAVPSRVFPRATAPRAAEPPASQNPAADAEPASAVPTPVPDPLENPS